jgi:hypothetical protein
LKRTLLLSPTVIHDELYHTISAMNSILQWMICSSVNVCIELATYTLFFF